MENKGTFTYKPSVFLIPILFVFSIWFVYWLEYQFGFNFNRYGVYPRTLQGLRGVFYSPFIHSGPQHLFNNSTPLFVLSAALMFFYRRIAFPVFFFGLILTGLLTWIIGRPSFHIGASGVIYMLVSFIFFSGIIRKYYRLVALSLIVVFLYGGMIWYIFPIKQGISWEGHLSGFLVGLLFAFIFRKTGPQKKKYEFKETEFDTYFDESGNFVPPSLEQTEQEENNVTSSTSQHITINYIPEEKKE